MTTPSYPQLRELISRLEGKDKAVVSMALYCLDKMDKKEEKLVNEAQSLRYLGEWGMTNGPYIVDETCLVFAKNIETENEELRAENEKLHREAAIRIDQITREQEAHLRTIADYNRSRVQSEKLRLALKPFADAVLKDEYSWKYDINSDDFRAAAAAIRESGE